MKTFAIMQEPGSQAIARRARYSIFSPPMKRAGTVEADSGPGALLAFLKERRYHEGGNKQFAGARLEWRSRRLDRSRKWKPDDGIDHDSPAAREREWSVVVTLQNGLAWRGRANRHDTRFQAWPA